ncbi:MAG: hypothetical protein E6J01_07290 [Chloroflexi bacterium]|nr:MAG: hypothetical protein E6J01_07290 [Chloroflexota bacterium]
MAAPAAQFFRSQPSRGGQLRLWSVGLTLAASVGLAVAAAHLPPVISSGANLRDPDQVIYARNIWQESQTSLVVLALFIPWLGYGLLLRGAPWGRLAVLVLAGAGAALGLWMTAHSLGLYAAKPEYVAGVVTRVDGRQITLAARPPRTFYLVVSEAELRAAQIWDRPGNAVGMWVAPNGQAGFIGRPSGGKPILQS